MTADLGRHPGYVLLRDGEVISVGGITALEIPVETLRTSFPVRSELPPGWPGRKGWADPGPPRGGPPWGPAPRPPGPRLAAGPPAGSG